MKNTPWSQIDPKPVNLDGVKEVAVRLLVTRADGAPNFSMRMFELGPDGHTLRHSHNYEHVVFVVEGTGELFHEGTTSPIASGSAILVPPGSLHQFHNTGQETMRFLCIIPNGDDVPDKMK